MLLRHACESLAAFCEGIEAGRVGWTRPRRTGTWQLTRPGRSAIVPASCWTPGPAPATSARSSTSPAARWRPASWPLRQPSRSPSTGGTSPGRADSASRSRAPWPSTCWRYPGAGPPHRPAPTVRGAGRRGGYGRPSDRLAASSGAPRPSAHASPLIGQPRQQAGPARSAQWRACHDSSGERGIAASEYDTFAPKRAVSRKSTHAGKGDEDPMPALSGAQRRRNSAAPPAPSQGIIDDRQELRRCEYVALGPVRAADVGGGTHSGSGLTQGVTLAQKRMICACP